MAGRQPMAIDEWYHCYTRGVDKRVVFEEEADFKRFTQLLYLCNSATPVHRSDIARRDEKDIYSMERGDPLVAIGAYCLMPNHFHLLLREIREGGISEFMRKVGIAYAMYFNIKNERVGNLFVKPFRAKHVSTDDYFRRVAQYIHLNPAELFEHGWKSGRVQSVETLRQKLGQYTHSSFPEYLSKDRPQKSVLDTVAMSLVGEEMPPIEDIITETLLYYRDLSL